MYKRHSQVNKIGALNYSRHRIIYLALEDEEFVKLLFVDNVCTFLSCLNRSMCLVVVRNLEMYRWME